MAGQEGGKVGGTNLLLALIQQPATIQQTASEERTHVKHPKAVCVAVDMSVFFLGGGGAGLVWAGLVCRVFCRLPSFQVCVFGLPIRSSVESTALP
jgi:hypothetical protein